MAWRWWTKLFCTPPFVQPMPSYSICSCESLHIGYMIFTQFLINCADVKSLMLSFLISENWNGSELPMAHGLRPLRGDHPPWSMWFQTKHQLILNSFNPGSWSQCELGVPPRWILFFSFCSFLHALPVIVCHGSDWHHLFCFHDYWQEEYRERWWSFQKEETFS